MTSALIVRIRSTKGGIETILCNPRCLTLEPVRVHKPAKTAHLLPTIKLDCVMGADAREIVHRIQVRIAVGSRVSKEIASINPKINMQGITLAWPESKPGIPHRHHCVPTPNG